MEPTERRDYEEQGHHLRAEIKAAAVKVKEYIEYAKVSTIPEGVDRGEMIANATLSYRHLEDAAMKIGKSMQAYQGGVSILDKMRDPELRGEGFHQDPCCIVDEEPDGSGI